MRYDEIPIGKTTISDLDLDAFDQYYQRIYEQPLLEADVPLTPMLENMRFLVNDLRGDQRLSMAGLLLFGKRPQDSLYYAYISAVRWDGIEAGESIIDQRNVSNHVKRPPNA